MLKIECFSLWSILAISMFSDGNIHDHKAKSISTLPFLDGQTDNEKDARTESGDVNQESFEAGKKSPSKRHSLKNSKNILVRGRRTSTVAYFAKTDFDFTEGTHREMAMAPDEITRKGMKDLDGRNEAVTKTNTRRRWSMNYISCKNTCKDRCDSPHIVVHQANLRSVCYCDVDCSFFKDCCPDFKRCRNSAANGNVSQPSRQISSGNSSNLVNQENRDLWNCFNGIRMIGSCPTSWPKDDVYYHCRNLSNADKVTIENYRYLPVYAKDNKVYHNLFCAKCNGVAEKALEMFTLVFHCSIIPSQNFAIEEKAKFLFAHCGDGNIKWVAREGQPRRYCRKYEIPCRQGRIEKDPPALSIPYPISIIFDFDTHSPSMTVKTRCSNGQVFDHYIEKCRNAIQPLPKMSHFDEYQILLWLKPSEDFTCSDIFELDNVEVGKCFSESLQHLKVTNVILSKIPCRIEFTLQVVGNITVKGVVDKILNFRSPFNLTINETTFTVSKVTMRVLSCTNLQKYGREEYQVLRDGTSVAIKTSGEILNNTDYYSNSTAPNTSQAIYVCRNRQMLNCSGLFILLNASEFTVLPNKSIFVNASGQLYDWSEYIWKKNGVEMCTSFSKTNNKASFPDAVLTMITLVCMSLSIVGLVFVLVTYSLFSELRTPPGINLMNLSVSILLAQLLWILGSGQTDAPMACTVIAVILHYLFLVSFMWTSIIAFDTWRAFSAKGRRPLADSRAERMKHYLRYMAVGWFSTLIYIAVCVLLDLTGTVAIGYLSTSACWIGNKLANLYFFAIPVGVVLIINSVFYTMTLRLINLQSHQARAASNRDAKQNFGIYVRIASLMGFTWVFGFAIPFGGPYLKYPFTLLNCLQGVYIAIAFGLNKRARRLYKTLFLGINQPARTETSNAMPCTDREEKPRKTQTKHGNTNLDTKL